MEDKEGPTPGVTGKRDEAAEGYHVAPRTANRTPYAGPTMQATAAPTASVAAPPAGSEMKKKRGRPRKYTPDGSLAMALSLVPISSSIPVTGKFSPWKRGRGRSVDTVKKSHKYEFDSSPECRIFDRFYGQLSTIITAYIYLTHISSTLPPRYLRSGRIQNRIFCGGNFTPHVITVDAGEDVTMKVMSFSQQGAWAICILSANGTISNVTLCQPTSSGGTLTYELPYYFLLGRFEILSLSGSFMPTENNGTKSRSGGMSVSLAGPDGRVLGGGLAGLLVAAGPVFLPVHQQEQKHKKQRTELAASVVSPTAVHTMSSEEIKVSYGGVKPILTSPSFHEDSSGTLNPIQDFRNSAIDNNHLQLGGNQKATVYHSMRFPVNSICMLEAGSSLPI
ncbi:hypothetical protein CRYUN_Cryun19dG0069000 [Craigia yunnanensis]